MNKLRTAIIGIVAFTLCACGNKREDNTAEMKNDSIQEENRYLNAFIDQVAQGMDSLIVGEDMLFNTTVEGTPMNSKQQITANLKVFEDILNRQRDRITELEKSLNDNESAHATSMRKIVSVMKAQLAEKDKEISTLKEELSSKDFSISRLESRIVSLNKDVEGLTKKSDAQKQALVTQSDMMNEAYVLIGSKKELKAAGILSSSGMFSRSKLNSSDFNASKFQKIDIRKYTSAKLNGKKPKVLTPSPASSYTITENGDGTSTLNITDPTTFWSVSNYLVIQTK